MGEHHGSGLDPLAALPVLVTGLVAAAAVLGYLAAVRRDAGRRRWPRGRTAAWVAGVAVLLAGSVGPLPEAAHTSFPAHAVDHVAVGMLGPLLLVLGAPVSLALRTLPVAPARRLTALLRSRPLRVLTEPWLVGLLSAGGLWVLYTTPLFALARQEPAVHQLVHLHVVLTGYLLSAVLVGPDPLPHRRSHGTRAAVLVAVWAAHGILAKYLYTRPPDGVGQAAAETGALVMYYGGDAVELVLAVLLCRRWFGVRRREPVALARG